MTTKIFFSVKKAVILFSVSLLALVACNSNNTKSSDSAGNTEDTSKIVKIGVLHSLTGTMAISEVSLKDAVQMAVDEINASGGVLGKQIEPVIVDPASDWDLFAEKAKELLVDDKVAAVFGCWTSVSRKSVLPVFEQNNGLLFYPVQYEGEESSKNIIYSGAVPNQQLIPAVDYLMSAEGGGYKRFYLLGTDYIFPRTANKILKEYLLSKGIPSDNIIEEYTPFHYQDYQAIVSKIKRFAVIGKSCVLSTINGDSNIPFYTEFANQGLTAATCPIMAFSVAEDELRTMDTEFLVDHLAAWNYFQSIDIPENKTFVANFKAYCKKHNLPDSNQERVTDDPICWAYTDVYLWAKAAEKAKSFDVTKVVEALHGLSFDSPAGPVKMDDGNHLEKTAMIGEIEPDGQFHVIWKSDSLIVPQPFFKLDN